jgi:uncharacterized integral membrane protein
MRLLIALPFLVVLVLFALSNTAPVVLRFWPTDFSVVLPLSAAILVGMAAAFLIGGIIVWFSALAQRSRARRAEEQVRRLEAQVAELKTRLAAPPARLPALPEPQLHG